jgi:hypothetical protein
MKQEREKNEAHQYRVSQAARLIESVRVRIGRRTYPAYIKNADGGYVPNPEVEAAKKMS